MMRRAIHVFAVALVLFTTSAVHAENLTPYIAEAQSVMQRLRAAMMEEMIKAQKTGTAAAIAVCRHLAPEISAEIEAETGWKVRRTALRVRNPENAPLDDEVALLRSFEVRNLSGQSPQLIRTARIIEQDGTKVFHMMQAVPTFDMCLGCHGENVDPATLKSIHELYPEDDAIGYKVGDLRGAFSLYKPMDKFDPAMKAVKPTLSSLGYTPTRDPNANGDATVGAALYGRYCQGCHAPDDLAPHLFPTAESRKSDEVCKFLETHGMTKGQQDCDVTAYLKDAARFLQANTH